MQYQIIGFNRNEGQIVVEYDSQWTFNIDLPVVNGLFPVGDELEALIQQYAPVWLAERKQTLDKGVANIEEIQALVVPKVEPPVQMPSVSFEEMPKIVI